MSVQRLSGVSGNLIRWAREEAGYEISEVASSCGFANENALKDIEEGRTKPTVIQTEKLAKKLSRPIAFFYLEEIPKAPEKLEDKRSPQLAVTLGPQSRLAIRRMHIIQDLSSELQKSLQQEFPTMPALSENKTPKDIAKILIEFLETGSMRRLLDRDEALKELIKRVESKGIIVSQQPMPRKEVQGASILKPYPVILINHSDYKSSKIFTLIHELCHLGLRTISSTCLVEHSPSKDVERFCNAVAGETLVPLDELSAQLKGKDPKADTTIESIADYFSVSKEVVLLRLISENYLDASEWDAKVPEWRAEIVRLNKDKHFRKATSITRAIRENGQQFTEMVLSSFREGRLSSSEASRYLNIRGGILEDVSRRI